MNDFDKNFRSVKRTATFGIAFAVVVNLAVIGGLGWALYRVVIWLTA